MIFLKDDIFAPVRQKLLEEDQHLLVKLPQDLEAKFVKSSGRAQSATGAKMQFAPAVPVAIVVGIREYLSGLSAGRK